jgi:two-component system alkaline phosphatase synthesis response regulator PhoP
VNETILVVDDEPRIVKLARDYLEKDGFRVITASDGLSALDAARRQRPDLVVLDLMLPEMDGWEVCRALRRETDVPIIMLTARAEETDQVAGLELGADEYVTKPFSPRTLVARVRALLRRAQGRLVSPRQICIAGLVIDLEQYRVTRDGEVLHLTPNEFKLLVVLAQHPGQVLSREQMIEYLHGVMASSFDRSVDSHVKNLRRKLEVDPINPRYIFTVYGVGYQFTDER